MDNTKKTFWIIMALIFSIVSCEKKYGDKEIYIIPEGFTGKIYVLYEKANGKPKAYKKEYRLYEVPKTGIIQTQFAQNLGPFISDSLQNWFQFYSIDSITGKEKRIPNYYYNDKISESLDSNSIYVFFHLEAGGPMEINNQGLKIFFIDSLKNKEHYKFRPIPDSIINKYW